MPNTTARLGLPIIAAAQAQKHVTHNEALQILDGITQLVLNGLGSETPPVSPSQGELHALGQAPAGAWQDQPGSLAQWQNGQWIFIAPQDGWLAWDNQDNQAVIFTQGNWFPLLQNLASLGIATQADPTNRLSVSSSATLLNHAGAGHQLKLNKAGAGDTAALLYQSNWAGHAELGLTGDNDFHIKTSPDGGSWTDALTLNAATGHATGAAVQSSATDTTSGRLARADYAYSPGNLVGTVSEAAGVPTGAVIERGSNANGEFIRFADGTQICTASVSVAITQSAASLFWTDAVTHDFPAVFASTPTGSGALENTVNGWVNGRAASATQWIFSAFSHQSRPANTVQLLAIGRWF